jgi:hypothetical protein
LDARKARNDIKQHEKGIEMTSNEYHFITHWHVKGTVKEVADVLSQATDLVRWWPSVYLDVQEVEPGDEKGIGKVVRLDLPRD